MQFVVVVVVVVVIGIVCLRIFDYDNDNDRKPSPNICTAVLVKRRQEAIDLGDDGVGLTQERRVGGAGDDAGLGLGHQ